MKYFSRILIFLILFGSLTACSRKKNTFISRNWHAVTTEYNTLYNGQLALEAGKEELRLSYEENFWDVLPVERMAIDDQILLPDSIRNQNFGRAEEKAAKAIQRHSMLIGGKERNPQIDEAYLLLGKARYYDQRFIPALEAFNYVLHKYPASNSINHARVWREKANIRLDNNRLAIENLKKVLEAEKLDDQDRADASASIAQAYLNLNYPDSSLAPLKTAAEFTKNNEEKGRYYFILGQLHNRLGQPEQANLAFDEVIDLNRKSPRIYMINAELGKIRNMPMGQGSDYEIRRALEELEDERENRPFLDKIYFQTAEFYKALDSTRLAEEYYNKSLRSPSSDRYLQSINYEILADMYFDRAVYRKAGNYYDSTLATMDTGLREFRQIKKKKDNLEDVILYEDLAEENDSILRLAGMSREEQIAYFDAYVEELKTRPERVEQVAVNIPQSSNMPGAMPSPAAARSFYFYDENRLSRGLEEFKRSWGNRPLADNWRYGEASFAQNRTSETQADTSAIDYENDPRFNAMTYVEQIPNDPVLLDSLKRERNFAWYQLGVIYKEKFREYELAAEKFEAMLETGVAADLELPAKFNLYEIYGITGRQSLRQFYKDQILRDHPDSRYAAYILNPESLRASENTAEVVYKELYRKFENGDYAGVIEEANLHISAFRGEEIVPKLELLKAMALGRLEGFETYKNALNQVALSYPQSEEGKRAQDIINRALPGLAVNEFNRDSLQQNYKLVYRFDVENEQEAERFQEELKKVIQQINYDLEVSRDVYTSEEIFVVIHGLDDASRARGFIELLQGKEFRINREVIAISTENYRIAQIHKTLNTYLLPPN